MNEAYHYSKPSAFSRGMEVNIGSARLVFVSGTASVGPNGESLHVGDFPYNFSTRVHFDNLAITLVQRNQRVAVFQAYRM